jgi:large subunit ribosomal protein L7/L12
MAKLSTDELLGAFKEMTLIELSEFVKEFEDVFDVKAAAPVAVAAAGGAAPAAEAAVEQDSFDVVLDAVEAAPKAILEGVNKEKAEAAKAKLEAEGAKVTLK